MIKHCQDEGSSSELVTGILVGLVVGNVLEITNCFPLPKDDEHEDESMCLRVVIGIIRILSYLRPDVCKCNLMREEGGREEGGRERREGEREEGGRERGGREREIEREGEREEGGRER